MTEEYPRQERRAPDPRIGVLVNQVKTLDSGIRLALADIKTTVAMVNDVRIEQAHRAGRMEAHEELTRLQAKRLTDVEKDIKEARKSVLKWAVTLLTAILTATASAVWVVKK